MTNTDKTRETKSSTTERQCTTIPAPPARLLDVADLFSRPSDQNDKPNLEKLKQHLLLEGRLTEQAALRIIQRGLSILIILNLKTLSFSFRCSSSSSRTDLTTD